MGHHGMSGRRTALRCSGFDVEGDTIMTSPGPQTLALTLAFKPLAEIGR